MKRSLIFSLFLLLAVTGAAAKTYYVATTGLDTNPGTIDSPFLTVTKGINSLAAGDTVLIRGGFYSPTATISVSKAGTLSAYYNVRAYPGERVVLDFSALSSSDGIKLNGQFWHLYGIEVKKAPHNGIAINSHNNIVEFCATYENKNTGMQLGNGASNNKIINCDSYFNYDPPAGGNADGFAPKLDVGTGNYFYGCRSWQNSDDGWDGYMRPADNVFTTLENCWSFMNGYLRDNTVIATGNGNGFKMGGGDNSNGDSLRHNMKLIRCLSFDNKVKGFDQNNNRGTMTLLNCTGYRNGAENYKVAGFIRVSESLVVKNCIELGGKVSLATFARQTTNSWTIPITVTASDFLSLDTTGVRGPRKADGSLPDLAFMHLAPGSAAINAGTNIGLSFNGSAPDLGAFETDGPSAVKPTGNALPSDFSLSQNYPNPFNPTTTISFTMAHSGMASLIVTDLLGRSVSVLADGMVSAGKHTVSFDASHLSSGMYLCTFRSGGFVSTKKMLLVR